MTIEENLSPSPVSVTTPTMTPATAQVAATLIIWREPSAIAPQMRRRPMRFSASSQLTAMASAMV